MENKPSKQVAVIGAGIAGMEISHLLSHLGYEVTLIEKDRKVGGHLTQWHKLFPDHSNPGQIITELLFEITNQNIKTITQTEITQISKSNGSFYLKSTDELSLKADAVVLTTGFKLFNAERKEEYGYGLFENVLTSADLEKLLLENKRIRTSSGKKPSRIAIIHCVGSRDAKSGNTYCSKVCCITGVKQALALNKLLPDCEIFCFYMDLRLYGSNFDELYLQAQKQPKIQFIRGRLSEASEKFDKRLQIKAEDTLSGRPLRMDVDMIVLLVGMEPSPSTQKLILGNYIQTDENGFFKSDNIQIRRNYSTQPGIFLAGTSICPMSVNETLENARSAAIAVKNFLEKS